MAINDKDFYASHGLDFDYKSMMDEYIKGVINQAKIEVLAEIQTEIKKLDTYDIERTHGLIEDSYVTTDVSEVIQQKINELKGN